MDYFINAMFREGTGCRNREAAHSGLTVVLGGQAGPLEIRMAGQLGLELGKAQNAKPRSL